MLAIAFTGGPGFGKSTTLAALGARGYKCVPESARTVIQERVSRGLMKRPPAREFAEQILVLDQAQYRRARESLGLVFFDRGVVDALGMCEEAGLSSLVGFPQVLEEYPFHRTAFIFPPWKDIYTVDAERDQTFEEAVAVDDAVRKWYQRCGFDLMDVPQADVDARCNFILAQLPGS
jgi:predicted ATPase